MLSTVTLVISVISKEVKEDSRKLVFVIAEGRGKVNGALSELRHEEISSRICRGICPE